MLQSLSCLRSGAGAAAVAVVLSVLLATPLHAQRQAEPGSQTEPSLASENKYSLSGTVVNSATGEPIRRALVQIFLGTNRALLTDGDGHFEFDDLPLGQTAVSATRPGFFSEQQISQAQAQEPMVSVPSSGPVVLKLMPEGVISGHVEANGEPLENVPLKVFAWRIAEGRKRWEMRSGATSDEDGSFRVANLTPGSYYVAAGPSLDFNISLVPSSEARQTGYPEVFYPSAPDIESSTPIELAAGQHVETDFSLKAEPIYEVAGTIVGIGGRGVNLQFINRSGENLPVPTQLNPATEKFQARVSAGSYVLRVFAQNENGLNMAAEQNITVGSDRSDLRLVLGSSASIPVNVRMDEVNPERTAGFRVIVSGRQPLNLHLSSAEASLNLQEYYANTGQTGKAELAVRDVPAGKYLVDIAPNGNWYVASAVCGSTDLMREGLTVPTGAHVPAIEIVLRNDGADLNVAISSAGRPASGAVLLIPDRAPNQPRTGFNLQGNETHFSGLAPGEYSVLAFERLNALEYRNPDFLSAYLSRASRVTLLPNGKATLATDVIRVEK